MNSITLFKPIVLRKSLDDMEFSQRETALELLTNRKVLVPGKDGFKYINIGSKDCKLPNFFLYGSEAVCYYRQSLGLPDVSITEIDVDEILTRTDDFDTLYDILHLLNRVHMRNERNLKAHDFGCPPIILWNEYRMLQEYVETLQDNNWCGHPVINSFDVPYEDDAQDPEHYELVRKSLVDIKYSLLDKHKA